MDDGWDAQLLRYLTALYGKERGEETLQRLAERLELFQSSYFCPELSPLDQRDSILITYADQIQQPGRFPLQTLAAFCEQYLSGLVSGVHILPFFPSSSDDGFAVMDYRAVDPAFGSWGDVRQIAGSFRLMVDAVVNHISSRSDWFQQYLAGAPQVQGDFISVPPQTDLSQVVRPRALPLLTPFDTANGRRYLWTTFSEDQIDLNYATPGVLLEMIDILLGYVQNGVQLIRLDAIAYLWKEIGTDCIHRPETHWIIQLIRAVLDRVAPQVKLITETNVPHRENMSYLGDGTDEAQMVYNFALPPLVLHSLQTGGAGELTQWAADLTLPSRQVTFFNFLASHDGVGLNPVRGILTGGQIDSLVEKVQQHGGLVSYKTNPDGSQSPYELNINYFDALNNPSGGEPLDLQVDRFMVSQAILLALVGIPGIYVHSLLGSRGWPGGVTLTGRNRTINRQKFERFELETELADAASLRGRVFGRYASLLRARTGDPAFHPHGAQLVLDAGSAFFALLRIPPEDGAPVLCLHHVTDRPHSIPLDLEALGLPEGRYTDLISGEDFSLKDGGVITFAPYRVLWLKPRGGKP